MKYKANYESLKLSLDRKLYSTSNVNVIKEI